MWSSQRSMTQRLSNGKIQMSIIKTHPSVLPQQLRRDHRMNLRSIHKERKKMVLAASPCRLSCVFWCWRTYSITSRSRILTWRIRRETGRGGQPQQQQQQQSRVGWEMSTCVTRGVGGVSGVWGRQEEEEGESVDKHRRLDWLGQSESGENGGAALPGDAGRGWWRQLQHQQPWEERRGERARRGKERREERG